MSTQCTLCFPDNGTAKEDTIPLDGIPREDHRDKDGMLEKRAGTGTNQDIYRSGSIIMRAYILQHLWVHTVWLNSMPWIQFISSYRPYKRCQDTSILFSPKDLCSEQQDPELWTCYCYQVSTSCRIASRYYTCVRMDFVIETM